MNPIVPIVLSAACVAMMILERLGAPVTLQLAFRGDVKRETQFLAQYGQAVCTGVAAIFVYTFDPAHRNYVLPLIVAVCAASVMSFLIKRLCGRMRPKHPNAGKFTGPSLKHDNARESFPSSHSACAVALTVVLAHYYPQGTGVFWTLALITAVLRYVLDAHWPSDVMGGIALGYICAGMVLRGFGV